MSPTACSFALIGLFALSQAAVPKIDGYTVTWSDDFIGGANSLPATNNWLVDIGTSYPGASPNWGTGEIQTYTSKTTNLGLDGSGNLVITPVKDASGAWTSARIETQKLDFMAASGGKMIIQASIAMPDVTGTAAIGYWPAFWTLGSAFRGNYKNWPTFGEFDIMENVNGANNVWGTLHCDVNPGGKCAETTGIGAQSPCIGKPCQGNFHTYAVTIDRSATPEKISWAIDGKTYLTVTQTQLGDVVWGNAVHAGHFILLNVAIGGQFPDNVFKSKTPVATTVSGKPMRVDYVAVYNSANGTAPKF